MKSTRSTLAPFVWLFLLGLMGCTNDPTPPVPKTTKVLTQRESDPFRAVLENFRYPDNPRPTDDWTRYREGLQHLGSYFTRPEVAGRLRLSSEERLFLENEVHLSDEEFGEIETGSFRIADAHHLDECFLLRDAARYLETSGLSPANQAERHFHWVMRNVYLHGPEESWTPPAFTLRRGFGTALERALVFIALLRQSQLDGCLIVAPAFPTKQFLVGVLDPAESKLYLFDTRLGMPVLDSDGKKPATLKDVQAHPALLAPSMISTDEAKKLEAWLACPLNGLAPRMLELQKGLSAHDSVALYWNAPRLARDIAAASQLPVKVWNAPAKDGKTSNSPTRALRMFLPKQEGGVAEGTRATGFMLNRLPYERALANYAQIGLNAKGLMPEQEFSKLMNYTANLFVLYDVHTREMFLRGQFEPALRRQERLQMLAKDDSLEVLKDNPAFVKQALAWREKLRDAHADVVNSQANLRLQADAQRTIQGLMSDPFVFWLLNTENEQNWAAASDNENQPRKERKIPVLTGVLAIGTRDYFDLELAYSRAAFNQEKAERAQSALRMSANPSNAARKKADEAWSMAESGWSNFYLGRIAIDHTVAERLKQLPKWDLVTKLGLLENLHRDVHQYFEAKLRLARCLDALGQTAAADAYRKTIQAEIEGLQKKEALNRAIKDVRETVAALPTPAQQHLQKQDGVPARLDRLERDWSDGGAFFWMKRRLAQKGSSQ